MTEIRFANVGFGDCVCVNRVLAVIQNGSTIAKRYQTNAKKMHKYVDATHGRSIRSFLLLDEGTVVASHVTPATLQRRLSSMEGLGFNDDETEEDEDEGLPE